MQAEGSVRSALYLYPKNGDYGSILDFMRTQRVLELSRENGGFLGGSYNVPVSGRGPMLVLATWRADSDYRRWLASPVRAAMTPYLLPLLDREPVPGEASDLDSHLRRDTAKRAGLKAALVEEVERRRADLVSPLLAAAGHRHQPEVPVVAAKDHATMNSRVSRRWSLGS